MTILRDKRHDSVYSKWLSGLKSILGEHKEHTYCKQMSGLNKYFCSQQEAWTSKLQTNGRPKWALREQRKALTSILNTNEWPKKVFWRLIRVKEWKAMKASMDILQQLASISVKCVESTWGAWTSLMKRRESSKQTVWKPTRGMNKEISDKPVFILQSHLRPVRTCGSVAVPQYIYTSAHTSYTCTHINTLISK